MPPPRRISCITNARLFNQECLWKIEILADRVSSVIPMDNDRQTDDATSNLEHLDAKGGMLIPSLCHSHIHLDKCFILDRCGELVDGDFSEAMIKTASAKAKFVENSQDLYDRGDRLIRESVQSGVTSMRAHVEIDTIVGRTCLDVAKKLKANWSEICTIQIAVFAQEPLFIPSTSLSYTPGGNFHILEAALSDPDVDVIGAAPYVEPNTILAKQNIGLILQLAAAHDIHCDFHLDYNFDPRSEPLIYEVLAQLQQRPLAAGKRVTIGHATRLQLLEPSEWRTLAVALKCAPTPITLVSLPQSDLYMLRSSAGSMMPRSTLHVPRLARDHGVDIAMSVNNVDNTFTPQGTVDPLSLCTLGVAIFQTAVEQDIETLVRSVTLTSKTAIGDADVPMSLLLAPGEPADFVLLHNNATLRSVVLNPSYDRSTIRSGRLVAQRRSVSEVWGM